MKRSKLFGPSSYGHNKRFVFIANIIKKLNPRKILDFGCGSGINLTIPLSQKFPNISFIGVDSDKRTIEFATKNNSDNLRFYHTSELHITEKFELIFLSEVIEHIKNPSPLLSLLNQMLEENGKIIVTLPNGYGPFEIAEFFQNMLRLSIFFRILFKKKYQILHLDLSKKKGDSRINRKDTYALSPHINFFSFTDIKKLFASNGFSTDIYRSRTFLAGFFLDSLIKRLNLYDFNNRISDHLPPQFSSGWMFLLSKSKKELHRTKENQHLNCFQLLHRNINLLQTNKQGMFKKYFKE